MGILCSGRGKYCPPGTQCGMLAAKGENAVDVIEVAELTRKFGAFTAVDRISFMLVAGEMFGFLGPNGAGKTATINMLCTR